MNITIIGASAGVGLETTRRALEQGHNVTTLSRSTESLPAAATLTAVKGSATEPADVRKALVGAEAVIVTLGTGTSAKDTTLYTDAAIIILEAMRDLPLTVPLIVVTGFGAGDSTQFQGAIIRTVMKVALGKVYANKSAMEGLLASSPNAWEIVRPARLTNRAATGKYQAITHYFRGMKVGTISRADVAAYLVDEAVNQKNVRSYPALTD